MLNTALCLFPGRASLYIRGRQRFHLTVPTRHRASPGACAVSRVSHPERLHIVKGFMTVFVETDQHSHASWQRQQPNTRRIVARVLLTLTLITLFAGSSLAWRGSSAKAQSASSLQHLTANSQQNTISQQIALTFAPWSWISDPSQHEWFSGDFNGDGRTDLAYLWDYNGTVEIYIAFSNGDGTFSTTSFQPAFSTFAWGWIADASQHQWFTGDFNNDGKTDLVYLWNYNGYVEAYSAFSNGDGSFNVNGSALSFGSEGWGWISDANAHQWFTGDFNGDGQTDLEYLWDYNGYVEFYSAFSNGDGSFTPVSAAPGWAWLDSSNHTWLAGDFNGDGKSDLAYLWNYNGQTEIYSAFSNGDGSFAVAGSNTGSAWQTSSGQVWATGDANGDGRADIIHLFNGPAEGITYSPQLTSAVESVNFLSQGDGNFNAYDDIAGFGAPINPYQPYRPLSWADDRVIL